MSKFILPAIIAILSYVCIAQSNLLDSPKAEHSMQEESAKQELSAIQEAKTEQEEQLEQGLNAEEGLNANQGLNADEGLNANQGLSAEEVQLEKIEELEKEGFIDPKVAASIKARFIDIDQNREARSQMWKGRVERVLTAMKVSEETKAFLYKDFAGTNAAFLIFGVFAIILSILLKSIIEATSNRFLKKATKIKRLRALSLYLDDLIRPFNKFLVLFGISICIYLNVANESLLGLGAKALALYFFWLGLSFILSVINTFFDLLLEKVDANSPAGSMLIPLARNVAITFAVVIFTLVVLENFGLNVSAILASLGIGGAALAFASKDTIANFFGSVSLVIDRPFVVGHEVKVVNWHGIVEKIGLRSTRIRTFDKTLICLPNSILANEYIENLSLRRHRKVEFSVGLVYSTTQEELQMALKAINNELEETKGVVKEHIIVRFDEFADSSLNIYIRFFTDRADFVSYMEIKDRANFSIMKAVRSLGLSMAFPSRSLYLENESINISQKNINTLNK